MSLLNKLSKLGAAAILAGSVLAMPAIAQHHGHHGQSSPGFNHQKAKFQGQHRGHARGNHNRSFRGNRHGSFRGHNRGSFRGHNRGSFRGNRFGHNGFRGNRFGHNGFRSNRFGHNSFRHNSFRSNRFRNNGFRRNHNGGRVNHLAYSVGGVYGVTSNTVFISDFGGHGLYAPPKGHHWVCDKGSKDAVLVAIATGAIIAIAADALLNPY